jgi:hypothetical protein
MPSARSGQAALGISSYGTSSKIRAALGLSSYYQAAHINPTALLRGLSNYSRGRAPAFLLNAATHTQFDAVWKKWARRRRNQLIRRGETPEIRVKELYFVMSAAIERIPNLSNDVKGALHSAMIDELFGSRGLGLSPDDLLEL